MKEESGRTAVWDHAAETNMQDTIRRISAVFPIDDISIYSPGKLTWLRERPRKYRRIRPFESDEYIDPATGEILRKD
ncbi:hypothetical protein [Klebsiella pasteurii]|uniref:hypothetical protein n=1 Tax=Klebsiella pasteurii TaxID=2587529 RepID=UPI0035D0E8EE